VNGGNDPNILKEVLTLPANMITGTLDTLGIIKKRRKRRRQIEVHEFGLKNQTEGGELN
jgi:hypothetical protein